MGRIEAVCISDKKGVVKHETDKVRLIKDFGLEGDAHAGSERQVSLLSYDKVLDFRKNMPDDKKEMIRPGCFGENLLVSGFDFAKMPVGTRFRSRDVLLELTQIGKKCHTGCEISKITGECIMPREGVFARVLEGGGLKPGDEIRVVMKAAVITASDRSYAGEREDKSGPLLCDILRQEGFEVAETLLLPDDEEKIAGELERIADSGTADLILTTGGTGFSPRDVTPEATLRVSERNAPGIAEGIRAYSMSITPKAMLSRGVSVIRKKTLIVNLPGSPKAVKECMEQLAPVLEHALLILRGEADG